MSSNIKPTDSELEILNILWEKGPVTVREVHEVLEKSKDAWLHHYPEADADHA